MQSIKPFKFKTDDESLRQKQAMFDPNDCLDGILAVLKDEEEFDYCEACESEQTVVFSFGIELENGVELSGSELGDNRWYLEEVESNLTNIVQNLEAYVDDCETQLAPVKEIYYGRFCACCLGGLD